MKSSILSLLGSLTVAVALLGIAPTAQASFVAYVCNDVSCDGAGDMAVTDNMGGDSAALPGLISFMFSTGGVSVTVNTSVSNSPGFLNPALNMVYTVIGGSAPGQVWLYASDTDFARTGPLGAIFNASSNPASAGAALYGANDNTNNGGPYPLDLTNSLIDFGTILGTGSYSASVPESSILAMPYFLTAGITVMMGANGVASGDMTVTIPEPASPALLGLAMLAALAFLRKRSAV